jgi:predicted oxidoreductase
MKRRSFIKSGLVGGGLMSLSFNSLWSSTNLFGDKPVPKRELGRAGDRISIIGFGAIMLRNEPQATCNDIVARAVEAGINYFDVAPTYGNAEEVLGPALEPFRKNSFLSCKSTQRERQGLKRRCRSHLKNSAQIILTCTSFMH